MSFGWQTESALLPSNSKSIEVGKASFLPLKALVLEKEQKRILATGKDKFVVNKFRIQEKDKCSKQDILDRKNKGIEERSSKDDLLLKKEKKTVSNLEANLQAKAELYDKLKSETSKKQSKNSFLIDFKRKKNFPENATQGSSISEKPNCEVEEEVEIVDEFGRNRVVSKSSKQYQDYILREERRPQKRQKYGDSSAESSTVKQVADPWAWSNGAQHIDDKEKSNDEYEEHDFATIHENDKALSRIIEERRDEIQAMSSSARIKTSWEKALGSSSREYLREVHQETLKIKEESKSSQLEATEDRREMLRKMIQERQQKQQNVQKAPEDTLSKSEE